MSSLVDPFGRAITYIRVSVTDRCDFRCVYCMSEDMTFLPKRRMSCRLRRWTASARLSSGSARGKLRVTGGEPLVRRNVMALFRSPSGATSTAGALEELTLTTNGSQLARFAAETSADCGVRAHQCVARHARSRHSSAHVTRWGDLRGGSQGHRRGGRGRPPRQDQYAVAMKGFQRPRRRSIWSRWAHGRGFDHRVH